MNPIDWFKLQRKKRNQSVTDEETDILTKAEEASKSVIAGPSDGFLRDLVKEEAQRQSKLRDPVEVRINKALYKLMSKIKEKHFSPEIQELFKKMGYPNYVSMKLMRRDGTQSMSVADIWVDQIKHWEFYFYNYKENGKVRDTLISKVDIFEKKKEEDDLNNITMFGTKLVGTKLFVECLYDYFFNGDLEKDIQYQIENNKKREEKEAKEKLEAADKLCERVKDL